MKVRTGTPAEWVTAVTVTAVVLVVALTVNGHSAATTSTDAGIAPTSESANVTALARYAHQVWEAVNTPPDSTTPLFGVPLPARPYPAHIPAPFITGERPARVVLANTAGGGSASRTGYAVGDARLGNIEVTDATRICLTAWDEQGNEVVMFAQPLSEPFYATQRGGDCEREVLHTGVVPTVAGSR